MRRREVLAALGVLAVSSGPVRMDQSRQRPGAPPPPDPDENVPTPAGPDGVTTPAEESSGDRRNEVPYDQELDVVSDLDCSPDGDEPCTDQLSAALEDGVLFRFPSGQYQFDRPLVVRDVEYVGFTGPTDEPVQLLPPDGFNTQLLNVANVGRIDFSNVTIDLTAAETTAGLRFITRDGFRVENVTYRGRGDYPAEEVSHAFYLAVQNPDGEGVLRNAVARQGSAVGHYKQGDGRGAVWIGPEHRGTAYVENCEFAEFGNNALYTSRNPGNVRVHGGTFRNNNVCGVRLSGAGSYVTGATIEVDLSDYDGPRSRLDSAFKTRGVVVEQGPFDNPPGVRIHDTTVAITNSPNPGPAVSVWPTGKSVTVLESSLRADGDTTVVHRRPEADQSGHSPSTDDRSATLVDVDVAGTDSQFPVLTLEDAPGSVLRNCRIQRAAQDRHGVSLVRSPETLLDGGVIEAGGYPILLQADFSSADCLVRVDRPPALRTGIDESSDTRWTSTQIDVSCQPLSVFSSRAAQSICGTCLGASDLQPLDGSVDVVGITEFENEQVELHLSQSSG